MKLLNKLKNNKTALVLLLVTTLFISCDDYLDVNTDTDNPTVAPLNLLLTNIQVSLGDINDFNNFTGSLISTYTHQSTSREEQDQYGVRAANISVDNDWNSVYLTLTNIQTLINQGTASGDLVYVGIAQIQKAYLMSYAVDLWGDVPYSEATQLQAGIVGPKFDDQKEIYNAVFELLKQGKANIASNAGTQKPTKDDLFYSGDKDKWIRFANSYQLKLYNQVRLSSTFDQAGFDALVAENNFFTSLADDFQMYHTKNLSPSDERNAFYLESYNSTQFGSYQSPWFYEILKGMNPEIHTDNEDPRIAYYFFNQLKPGKFPPDTGNTTTGNPGADYWDASTGFFSIRFGSTGPDRDKSAENSYTYPGIFPAGGRYDDKKGGAVDGTTKWATGIAPHRIFTYAEFLYVQAELMQVGKLTGDVAAKLEQALNASFAKVDEVVVKNASTQTIPKLVNAEAVTIFKTKILAEFAEGSADKKLQVIMTQKWVATFGDPMDQYTDYRRTGFPILANPRSVKKEYQLNNDDGFPLNDAQTVQNNEFQQSYFWPQDELNVNQNAPGQKNPATYKIFWAK